MKRILILGGAGYLGSVLCRRLLQKEYKVRVMDICLFGEKPIEQFKTNPNFEFIKQDIRSMHHLKKAIQDVDAVILLAAIVGDKASQLHPTETMEINYYAAKMIAKTCKQNKIPRFIFASTCSVYGTGDKILTEESELNPVSLYAISKIKSEAAILKLKDASFHPTIMRMGTLYGLSPRMRFDLVVNTFVAKAVCDGVITVFGGEQYRPLLYVDDAAEAYIKCLEAPLSDIRGQIFNVGSNNQNYKIKDIATLIKNSFLCTKVIQQSNQFDTKTDMRDYKVSFDKIKHILRFNPKKQITKHMKIIGIAIACGRIKDYTDSIYYNE